jgi:hypothetical protein
MNSQRAAIMRFIRSEHDIVFRRKEARVKSKVRKETRAIGHEGVPVGRPNPKHYCKVTSISPDVCGELGGLIVKKLTSIVDGGQDLVAHGRGIEHVEAPARRLFIICMPHLLVWRRQTRGNPLMARPSKMLFRALAVYCFCVYTEGAFASFSSDGLNGMPQLVVSFRLGGLKARLSNQARNGAVLHGFRQLTQCGRDTAL